MIRKNLFYNTVLSISQFLFPLIIFPYTSKILGPGGMGLISFADSITQYLILLASIGVPIYGLREIAKVKNDQVELNKVFTTLLSIQMVTTFSLSVFYLGTIFTAEKLQVNYNLYLLSCGILIANVFSVEWFFQGIEKFRYITTRTISIRIIFILLILICVHKGTDVYLYYSISFITIAINAGINFFYALRHVSLDFSHLKIKKHLKPLLYISFSSLAVSVYIILDNIILGFLADNTIVGYYSTAVKICKIPLTFISAISMVLIPQIASSYSKGDHNRVAHLLSNSFAYIIMLAAPISVGMFILAPDIVMVLTNKSFLPAISAVKVMAPLTLLIGLSNLFAVQMLTPMGKEKVVMFICITGVIISVCSNLVLIPLFSFMGTTYTSIFTELVVTSLSAYFALKHFKIVLPYHIVWQSFLLCLFFFPVYYIAQLYIHSNLLRIMAVSACCMTLYFGLHLFAFKNVHIKQMQKQVLFKLGYGKV